MFIAIVYESYFIETLFWRGADVGDQILILCLPDTWSFVLLIKVVR